MMRPIPNPPLQVMYLCWQNAQTRDRRVVAEVRKRSASEWSLRYAPISDDFEAAVNEGFLGYPAFPNLATEHTDGVQGSLSTRIPPPRRTDFEAYLKYWFIDPASAPTAFEILAYSGGILARDTFRFVPVLDVAQPFDLVTEIAGVRYNMPAKIPEKGDIISVAPEPDNSCDSLAVAFYYCGARLGHMMRGLNEQALKWLKTRPLEGEIVRVNGTRERPILLAHVFEKATQNS